MTKQEAIHELKDIFSYGFYNARVDEAVSMAIEALEADAVEVVRCDYCKWSDWYTIKHEHISVPLCYCTRIEKGGYTSNDYCSYGERSEE